MVAAVCPQTAFLWPMVLIIEILVILWGYGMKLRYWSWVAIFIAGFLLYVQRAIVEEKEFRASPWKRNARQVDKPFGSDSVLLRQIKRDLSRRVGLGLSASPWITSLNRAILLGERGRLDPALKKVFVESGTIHVFAISGLHVMIVARMLATFMAFLLVPSRWSGLLAMPLLWLYVMVIGMPPSAVRAALMATMYFSAPLFYRRPDGLNAWGCAFMIMHAIQPRLIIDVGSELSFMVMLSLILAGRAFHYEGWRQTLWMSFAAWAGGAPIAAWAFERITPGGLLANLVLLGTAAYSVMMGTAGILTSFVSDKLAEHFNNLSGIFTDAMVAISETVSRLPFANFEITGLSGGEVIAIYAVLGVVIAVASRFELRSQEPF